MRSVFFISDQTGITTEKLGTALLMRFPNINFRRETIPFVDTQAKMAQVLIKIKNRYLADNNRPILVSSIFNPELRKMLHVDYALSLDFFDPFLPLLEAELGEVATQEISTIHGIGNEATYNHRIEAIHYSLENDDGISTLHYDEADIIIIGVSRVGKTPTSIYLAVNYGIKVANYPFTEQDLQREQLPKPLRPFFHKLFGLTIDPARLHQIRTGRLPNSKYAELKTCMDEVSRAEHLLSQVGVPFLDTSKKSIEEISVAIMQQTRIKH